MDKVKYMCDPLLWAYVFNKPTVPFKLYNYNAYVHHYKATGTPTCTKGTDFEWGERTGLGQTACVRYSVQPV